MQITKVDVIKRSWITSTELWKRDKMGSQHVTDHAWSWGWTLASILWQLLWNAHTSRCTSIKTYIQAHTSHMISWILPFTTSLHFASRSFTPLHFASHSLTSIHLAPLGTTWLRFDSSRFTLLHFASLRFVAPSLNSPHFAYPTKQQFVSRISIVTITTQDTKHQGRSWMCVYLHTHAYTQW